ncbi:MAG TPA: hypothetical protein GX502_08065 [Syntrophaceticus sp.]|nr:hypothetical protein [Syntrophaceticus sp.]
MQILINTSKTSLETFKRATGVEFRPLESTSDRDAVAVVVQGNSFEKDISTAIQFGVPVVVVAGNDRECVEQATKYFIPESCILTKQNNSVVTADGKKIAETVGGGIGVRAVVKAAEYALKNKLCPEPLVWIESEPTIEPVISTVEKNSVKEKKNVIPLHNPAEGILDIAKRIVVVFKATPDAESGKAAYDLATSLNGVHAELANKQCSYCLYGNTIEDAVATGKYITCDGKTMTKGSFVETDWLVVEIDTSILASSPKLVDSIYKKADKIVHVVGDYEKGKLAIDAWRSSWRLDAVVSNKQNYGKYKKAYGDIVITDIGVLTEQLA